MKKLFAAALLTAAVLCAGCGGGGDKKIVVEGGTKVVDLPPGEKFVNFATNKYCHYIIHRKRHADEKAEEYEIDELNHEELTSRYVVVREH